jgi:hypothetical protein
MSREKMTKKFLESGARSQSVSKVLSKVKLGHDLSHIHASSLSQLQKVKPNNVITRTVMPQKKAEYTISKSQFERPPLPDSYSAMNAYKPNYAFVAK